jgi:hypothetical protein
MSAAQGRLADTIDIFYGSADRASDGAMAANAYKHSVDELEASVSSELVSPNEPVASLLDGSSRRKCPTEQRYRTQ